MTPSPQALKRAREIPEVAWAYGFFKAASVKDGPINPDGLIQGVAQALDAHAKEAVEAERSRIAKILQYYGLPDLTLIDKRELFPDEKEYAKKLIELANAILERNG